MTIRIEVSEVINRPVGTVFNFYADNHVKNHPRWDPYMELWLDSDEPLGVGTIIRRRNNRSGTPVEGTMEIVEFERDRAFGALIQEGPMKTSGRVTFESLEPNVTRISLTADFPIDPSMKDALETGIKQSYSNIKRMIEQENA